MSVIEYHNNPYDPFTTTETENRENNYYGGSGHPTMWFDGVLQEIASTNYRAKFDTRKNIASPLTIELNNNYDSTSRQGTVSAFITNTSGGTISGALRFVLTETNIAYAWQGEDSLFFVARDMLPNEIGETVVLNAGDTLTKSQPYTISSSWAAKNCNIIAFVQGSSHEIYQGARLGIAPGVEENSGAKTQNSKLTANPNPFICSTILKLTGSGKQIKDLKMQVYDISGKLVLEPNNDIIGENLNPGIYFVKARINGHIATVKIIKTR